MKLISSSVGKKILMAITGQVMVLFVIVHVIGNSTVYFNWLNDYAEHLHSLPPLVWAFRLVMTCALLFHVYLGIQLTLENSAAKPEGYAVKKSLKATFASKNMIWTGLAIGAFLLYHLLHFTLQITNPEIAANANMDALGRPDVMSMVMQSFQNILISLTYVLGMTALLLHLSHGIQSSLQTFGLSNEKTMPAIIKTGDVTSAILFIGYVTIPIIIFLGILKG